MTHFIKAKNSFSDFNAPWDRKHLLCTRQRWHHGTEPKLNIEKKKLIIIILGRFPFNSVSVQSTTCNIEMWWNIFFLGTVENSEMTAGHQSVRPPDGPLRSESENPQLPKKKLIFPFAVNTTRCKFATVQTNFFLIYNSWIITNDC